MCTDGIGHLVMSDETIQELLANSTLDLVHKQVVMTLYSMEAGKTLSDYKRMLPIYLGMNWQRCSEILREIEKTGLIEWTDAGITILHPVQVEEAGHGCGCH
jgi:hypothetical protein